MENDETVEKLVIPIHGFRNVVPPFRVDGAAVEQIFKFVDGVADAAFVGTDWCSQALDGLLRALVVDYDFERLWVRTVVERGEGSQSEFEEVPCLLGVSNEA